VVETVVGATDFVVVVLADQSCQTLELVLVGETDFVVVDVVVVQSCHTELELVDVGLTDFVVVVEVDETQSDQAGLEEVLVGATLWLVVVFQSPQP
jgi:hypothetical protein